MAQAFRDSKPYKTGRKVFDFLLAQWFFILLAVFIVLAWRWPSFAKQGGTIKAEYSIGYGAVAVIFLISGLSISSREFAANLSHWRAHFTVLTSSFLITSSIIYGIVSGIKAAQDSAIDNWLLVGLIVTHCCPTTVSSNVVMTKAADGNHVLTVCEVLIGNLLGAFITPALVQMYLTGTWEFGNPTYEAGISVLQLYANVMKQIGLSVFVPLFVGQVVQNIFPKQTKWCLTTFKLNKVGSFMLLLIMYQSFSTAFAQDAFTSVSHASIIFLVFFNIGIYLFFTVLVYFYLRPPFILWWFPTEPTSESTKAYTWGYKFLRPFYYNRRDTVSMMLCGPAKTAALGVSLISAEYGATNAKLGILLVPLVLYQAEQVFTAQILVKFMKKWVHAEDAVSNDEESVPHADETTQSPSNETFDTASNKMTGRKSLTVMAVM
ncbi:hypothetical protein METBIDRAFT_75899 [Metschnikowia bicuspidata var. bicuspidata NRRL YB-4993]|uniref:Uncharacterized protein n=1 Tax=Metschnikowia bicuspidata var. bicuspidata NRRL YB-4993 TaxID=869754 RepID=A0A1A0HFD4_9ASCO|nr:hypothetical protein METBIDRAFT_75899 [Metschnikowia bicuspidata var. bicuspidata NRRL YB-4993]OBA22695.1 hypothetical protein METBIDRAFT_75899 [Metschnikowia bicuspidata var. bicuspidata NRRL YB-4993]